MYIEESVHQVIYVVGRNDGERRRDRESGGLASPKVDLVQGEDLWLQGQMVGHHLQEMICNTPPVLRTVKNYQVPTTPIPEDLAKSDLKIDLEKIEACLIVIHRVTIKLNGKCKSFEKEYVSKEFQYGRFLRHVSDDGDLGKVRRRRACRRSTKIFLNECSKCMMKRRMFVFVTVFEREAREFQFLHSLFIVSHLLKQEYHCITHSYHARKISVSHARSRAIKHTRILRKT